MNIALMQLVQNAQSVSGFFFCWDKASRFLFHTSVLSPPYWSPIVTRKPHLSCSISCFHAKSGLWITAPAVWRPQPTPDSRSDFQTSQHPVHLTSHTFSGGGSHFKVSHITHTQNDLSSLLFCFSLCLFPLANVCRAIPDLKKKKKKQWVVERCTKRLMQKSSLS